MRIAVIVALSMMGCSKGASPCPSVDELARVAGSGAERRELQIVVDRCRADNWPSSVTDCMRKAQNDEQLDPCMKALTAAQVKRLEEAFEPINAEYAKKDVAEVRDHDALFGEQLAELRLEQLTARAAQCADFVTAIAELRKATLACKDPETILLEQYASQQQVLRDAKELAAAADADLASACTQMAAGVRDEAKQVCD